MTTPQRFQAVIDDFIAEVPQRVEAVFKESTKRTIRIMQRPRAKGGRMPVDTGFLRSSLDTTLNAPAAGLSKGIDGQTYTYNDVEADLIINQATIYDRIFATYSAVYARRQNYGFGSHPGYQFVGMAAQKWQATVNEVVRDLRQRLGS